MQVITQRCEFSLLFWGQRQEHEEMLAQKIYIYVYFGFAQKRSANSGREMDKTLCSFPPSCSDGAVPKDAPGTLVNRLFDQMLSFSPFIGIDTPVVCAFFYFLNARKPYTSGEQLDCMREKNATTFPETTVQIVQERLATCSDMNAVDSCPSWMSR